MKEAHAGPFGLYTSVFKINCSSTNQKYLIPRNMWMFVVVWELQRQNMRRCDCMKLKTFANMNRVRFWKTDRTLTMRMANCPLLGIGVEQSDRIGHRLWQLLEALQIWHHDVHTVSVSGERCLNGRRHMHKQPGLIPILLRVTQQFWFTQQFCSTATQISPNTEALLSPFPHRGIYILKKTMNRWSD